MAKSYVIIARISLLLNLIIAAVSHEAKDFDDSILYKIDFEVSDLVGQPDLGNQLRTFYTPDKEKYDCLIPTLEHQKEEEKSDKPELSPISLLQPIFSALTCTYRIEAYWSYEICHGHHVRQYHEEREGKNVKFQEYYLGKWTDDKMKILTKDWSADIKAGVKPKYKSLKIDNTRYPYFEMEYSDGTMCDIINAPRTTMVRYVCYPHGKDDIYSFKETSSCNYEAIILSSTLCAIRGLHAEETKELSIQCFNSESEPHSPLSMLRSELKEWTESEADLLVFKEKAKTDGDLISFNNGDDIDKVLLKHFSNGYLKVDGDFQQLLLSIAASGTGPTPITDLTPLKDFISGKNCLTGGNGWWKYEFCYGRHVRQFHKDKTSEVELFLGYFSEEAHRAWSNANPDKGARRSGFTTSIWHHYGKGTHCEQIGVPREVDVKLTCTPVTNSGTAVSMYLLEPKTCQYILVVESPTICDLMHYADSQGLVKLEDLDKILVTETDKSTTSSASAPAPAPAPTSSTDEENRP
ncbi:endoplasmic reticulum lectin 1 [Drosophila sechellia]|uniref:Endoplasmic reticulum lectin 1 n=2 Tax=Drosophila sechellia TaxID=7238 RepID=B4IE49_DROSE|nr:endoplasmic reticulum lectin 1 [Drosophila sechellia]EDW45876.1 GM26418 [Drosophila sechellia]